MKVNFKDQTIAIFVVFVVHYLKYNLLKFRQEQVIMKPRLKVSIV